MRRYARMGMKSYLIAACAPQGVHDRRAYCGFVGFLVEGGNLPFVIYFLVHIVLYEIVCHTLGTIQCRRQLCLFLPFHVNVGRVNRHCALVLIGKGHEMRELESLVTPSPPTVLVDLEVLGCLFPREFIPSLCR